MFEKVARQIGRNLPVTYLYSGQHHIRQHSPQTQQQQQASGCEIFGDTSQKPVSLIALNIY